MAHIFLCYSRKDSDAVDQLVARLEERGGQVWIDRAGIPGGELWGETIVEAIETCDAVVVVLTPNSVASRHVSKEVRIADDKQKRLIPAMLKKVTIPRSMEYHLGGLQEIDLTTEDGFERLAAALGLGKSPAKATKPTVNPQMVSTQESPDQGIKPPKAPSADEIIGPRQDDPGVYYLRGCSRYEKGDLDGAIQDFTAAIQLKPDDAYYYLYRGDAHHRKGNLDEAIRDFTQAIRLMPEQAGSYDCRGDARADKGDLNGAFQDYDEAIRLKPNDAYHYGKRGKVNLKFSFWDSAIQDFSAAIRLNPYNAQTYNHRGTAREEKGDLDGAIQDYTEALRIKPEFPAAKENLARALKSSNKR
jgi:Flp pilus assembly protein TadD